MQQKRVAGRACYGAGVRDPDVWGGGTTLSALLPEKVVGPRRTPQSCPQVVMAILSLQSFFEGWDASKKKDKTKGRQEHISTCECLQQRLRDPEQLEKPSKGLWGLFLVGVHSMQGINWWGLVGQGQQKGPCSVQGSQPESSCWASHTGAN